MPETGRGITYPDGTNLHPSKDWWQTLAVTTDAAIADAEAAATFARALATPVDLNLLYTAGVYRVTGSMVADTTNLPPTSSSPVGVLFVGGSADSLTWGTQWFTVHGTSEIWWRTSRSTTPGDWNAWAQVATKPDVDAVAFPRPGIAAGTDLNTIYTPGTYRLGASAVATATNLPPSAVASPIGILIVGGGRDSLTWGTQFYAVHGTPELWWRSTQNTSGAWNAWVRIAPASTATSALPAGTPNEMRLQAFRDAYPLTSTGGKGAVVFRYDHGLTNIKTTLLAMHQARDIPLYIAMNSRNWASAENSGATQQDVKDWIATSLVEIGNHGADHNDHSDPAGLFDTIVNGRKELEAQLDVTVHGFTVPGVGGTGLGGFGAGTLNTFSETLAGSLILANHAVSSGAIGSQRRPLDGVIRQGRAHYTFEARTFSEVQTQIDQAITTKTALTLFAHPMYLNVAGYWTTALAEQVLDYVAAKIASGDLAPMSYYQSLHASL